MLSVVCRWTYLSSIVPEVQQLRLTAFRAEVAAVGVEEFLEVGGL